MWLDLFFVLLLAHLVADFVFQTKKSCQFKRDRKWRSPYLYIHGLTVFAFSWLFPFDISFWWVALVIGVSHTLIDVCKTYMKDNVGWFAMDQVLHIGILAGVAFLWTKTNYWVIPFGVTLRTIALIIAVIVCWKPANIFIKLMLTDYSVHMPQASQSGFNAGALIGNLERWLILAFVILGHYEAIGLLIAAKSIIRFGEKETVQTEYVLAGTLMSIFIAVMAGLFVTWIG